MTLASNPPSPSAVPGSPFLLPHSLRNFVRQRELGVVLTAVFIGFLSGMLVVAISKLSQLTQAFLFAIPVEAHLDATLAVPWHRRLLVPVLGGFVLSMMVLAFAGRLKSQLADAIEANALYGGRLSMRGSLFISIQTLLSNCVGGS